MDSPRRGPNFQRFGVSTSINADESIESLPAAESSVKRRITDLWASRHSRVELLLAYWIIAFVILISITQQSWFGALVDGKKPLFLTCNDRKWDVVDECTQNGWSAPGRLSEGAECYQPTERRCGFNGYGCLPFNDTNWIPIHCYQSCIEVTSAVFGSGYYRADSIICAAAAHSGVIGASGGCALMRMVGQRSNYEGTFNNSVMSKAFNFSFPASYIFKEAEDSSGCTNLESSFILTALSLVLFSLVLFRPSKPFIFIKLLATGFWIVLVAFTPQVSPMDRLATLCRDVPVLLAAGAFVYIVAGEHALYNPITSSLPNIFFYLIPFMAGLSIKSIFDWVPSSPDTATWAFIVVFATMVGLLLAYHLWLLFKSTCLKRMVFTLGYLAVGLFYLVSWIILQPDYGLHFHHATVALMLVPLTRWRNRPVVSITQALLLGTIVNGIALEGWIGDFAFRYPTIVPPNPPTCGVSQNNSLQLHWNGNADPQTLGLALYMNFVEVSRQSLLPPVKNVSFQVRDLVPHTTYQLTVCGIYDEGKLGPPSQAITCTTT